jgi:hypothetical protein
MCEKQAHSVPGDGYQGFNPADAVSFQDESTQQPENIYSQEQQQVIVYNVFLLPEFEKIGQPERNFEQQHISSKIKKGNEFGMPDHHHNFCSSLSAGQSKFLFGDKATLCGGFSNKLLFYVIWGEMK